MKKNNARAPPLPRHDAGLVRDRAASPTRSSGPRRRAPPEAADDAAAVEEVPRGGFKSWFISNRTPLLFGALVSQKVLADVVTDYTRRQGAYSGATVSMLSEVAKFPVLVAAICAFAGGPSRLWPTVKRAYSGHALQDRLDRRRLRGAERAVLCGFGTHIGGVVPGPEPVQDDLHGDPGRDDAQGKIKEARHRRVGLFAGRLDARAALGDGRRRRGQGRRRGVAVGGGFAVLGALLSAVPNVWYEKLLKTPGEDEWARNVQVTVWIFSWIALSQLWTAAGAVRAELAGAVDPFASLPNFGARSLVLPV